MPRLVPLIVLWLICLTALSLAWTSYRLGVPVSRWSRLTTLGLASKLLWAYWLVFNALWLALTVNTSWVVWVASVSLTLTGLSLVTRTTRAYVRVLLDERADALRRRYGEA